MPGGSPAPAALFQRVCPRNQWAVGAALDNRAAESSVEVAESSAARAESSVEGAGGLAEVVESSAAVAESSAARAESSVEGAGSLAEVVESLAESADSSAARRALEGSAVLDHKVRSDMAARCCPSSNGELDARRNRPAGWTDGGRIPGRSIEQQPGGASSQRTLARRMHKRLHASKISNVLSPHRRMNPIVNARR